MGACSTGCGTISTFRVGTYFNAAVTRVGSTTLFTSNADSVFAESRARNCTSEHRVDIRGLTCQHVSTPARSPTPARRRISTPLLTTIRSAQPHRVCQDLLNFRGNGPEDARVLPLTHTSALLLFVDYSPAADGGGTYHRRMHYRILSLASSLPSLGPVRVLAPASPAIANLTSIEKVRVHSSIACEVVVALNPFDALRALWQKAAAPASL